jgi:hypothetical protein
MADYSFRVKVKIAKRSTVELNDREWHSLDMAGYDNLRFRVLKGDTTGPRTTSWEFRSSGYKNEETAERAGEHFQNILIYRCVKQQTGIDIGKRGSKGLVTNAGLELFERQFERRCLNDVDGLSIFETESEDPAFISINGRVATMKTSEKLQEELNEASQEQEKPSRKQQTAIELFNASFFETSMPARFVLLITSIEVLFKRPARKDEGLAHAQKLVELTKCNTNIPENERASMLGSVCRLKQESISQAGTNYVKSKMGKKEYMEIESGNFFKTCYSLRSDFVHGSIKEKTWNNMGRYVNELEKLVSDLLCS